MKKLITLLTVIFFVAGLSAQTGTIKGIVKDKKTGELLPGATIYIEVAGSKKGAASDVFGKYTIKPINSGTYIVTTSMIGYKTVKMYDVSITSDKITYVNLEMEDATHELGLIEIIEDRWETPLIRFDEPHVKVLTAKAIANDPNLHNPMQLLDQFEGVTVAPNGKDVYIRGARPISTQFITDGMKSITGDIGIPGTAIGSIKVYTGGVPAKYGDVSGGVIVVETKSYFDLLQQYK
jgi:CarboxypepD_reg-like domain/TonB-dependent Receptor Plug Domain